MCKQIAKALVNRGIILGENGDEEKALADYNQIIEKLPGTPVEQVASAFGNRGWIHYQRKDYPGFLTDTEAALEKKGDIDAFSFNLGLAFLASNRDADALAAYRKAGERFPDKIEALALPDLADAQKDWLSVERAAPVLELIKSLIPKTKS